MRQYPRSVRRRARRLLAALGAAAVTVGGLGSPALAASVTSATFSGAGTVLVDGTRYAEQGQQLTLTVATSLR